MLPVKKFQFAKHFFLATLDISDKAVASASGVTEAGFVEPDRRGKHNSRKKLPDEIRRSVHEHIASFPCVESHYLRKDITREYLEEGLSLATMY